jgi:hypothetical protein
MVDDMLMLPGMQILVATATQRQTFFLKEEASMTEAPVCCPSTP